MTKQRILQPDETIEDKFSTFIDKPVETNEPVEKEKTLNELVTLQAEKIKNMEDYINNHTEKRVNISGFHEEGKAHKEPQGEKVDMTGKGTEYQQPEVSTVEL